MAHVEFAEEFAHHFGEVVVVVDVGEEFAVCGSQRGPVNSVHILDIESLGLFTDSVVEHEFAFGRRVKELFGTESDGSCFRAVELA